MDSRGEVDTQEAAPTSLFGDPPNSEETQMPSEERAEETLEQGTPTQLNTTGNDTAEGGTDRPAGQLPSYWHPREAMAGVDVPSSAEHDGGAPWESRKNP